MEKKEMEIVRHTTMNHLEVFIVEMTSRGPHGHDDFELGMILEGTMTLFLEQEQYHLKAGNIYFINRYQVHSFSNKTGRNRILAFQIDSDFYKHIFYQSKFLHFEDTVFCNGPFYLQLRRLLLNCARCYFSETTYNELKCSELLIEIMYQLLTNARPSFTGEKEYNAAQTASHRINRITDYIAEHSSEKISLQDIADLEHITTYHASHFITKILGISFQDYLNNVRFEHALELIQNSDLSILDICMETGFSSSRYLNKLFEEKMGCTAREYLKTSKKPHLIDTVLPTDNIQKRYSFEQSAFILQKVPD